MEISTYPNGDGQVVKVVGELTAQEPLARLPTAVRRIVEAQGPAIVKVNVREVEIVDLEGIASLVEARKVALEHGARFALIDGQPRVRHRLEVTGLLQLLEEDG
jgi:anti-anti-sigma factor